MLGVVVVTDTSSSSRHLRRKAMVPTPYLLAHASSMLNKGCPIDIIDKISLLDILQEIETLSLYKMKTGTLFSELQRLLLTLQVLTVFLSKPNSHPSQVIHK